MPTFIDYLLAPWRVFVNLIAGAPPRGGGVAANNLCYYQDMGGGQIVHVCRVAGYEMPTFIFWACLLILFLFIFASRSLIKQCTKIEKDLSELLKLLDSIPKAENNKMTKPILDQMTNLISKEKLVGPAWEQFRETLLVTKNEEIYSTCALESVVSKQAVIEENVNTALFNALPGVLTGVGLLMTFVAILDGLSHVTVAANMDVRGIGGLINGLSGKFASSIVAVTCAVSFVFIERFAYSKPTKAYRTLINNLSKFFKRRTTEHLLLSIQDKLEEQQRGKSRKSTAEARVGE